MVQPERPRRILIVEDHPIVRQGYAYLIGEQDGLEVCGYAATEAEAIQAIQVSKPHLVIIDITLKQGHGIELMKRIRDSDPRIKMLVISGQDELVFAERSLDAGALGYINKQEATERLVDGVRCVLKGEVYVSDRITRRLLKYRAGQAKPSREDRSEIKELTDRELEVFQLLGQGLTTKRIANQLSLSPKTVDRYRENIKAKLQIRNSTELIQRATQWVMESGT